MKSLFGYAIMATLLVCSSAHADIICVKEKVKVQNDQVRVARSFKSYSDTTTCPNGYKLLLDEGKFATEETVSEALASFATKSELSEYAKTKTVNAEILALDSKFKNYSTTAEINDTYLKIQDAANYATQQELDVVSEAVKTVNADVYDTTSGLATKASQSSLDNVSKTVTALDSKVNNTTSGLDTKASSSRVTVLENQQTTLSTSIINQSASISNQETRISKLEGKVGDSESGLVKKVADNTDDISNIEAVLGNGTTDGLVKDVADLQSEVETLKGTAGKTVSGIIEVKQSSTELVSLPFPASDEVSEFIIAPNTKCKGSAGTPIAPAGTVCVYPWDDGTTDISAAELGDTPTGISKNGFKLENNSSSTDHSVTWAYQYTEENN